MRPIFASIWSARGRMPSRSRCCAASRPSAAGCRRGSRMVVENWLGIMSRTKKVTAFTSSYAQAAVIFPYVLVAPAYFAGRIQLGGMMQTASAFGSVQDSLSFFISSYRTLAEWQSVVQRLDGFEASIENAAEAFRQPQHPARQGGRQTGDRSRQARRQPAGRRPPGVGRQFQHSRQRAHAGDRALRRRQVDLVPRHCRGLAVRDRHDRDSRQCQADDAAAAAVFSDRQARGRHRLPG